MAQKVCIMALLVTKRGLILLQIHLGVILVLLMGTLLLAPAISLGRRSKDENDLSCTRGPANCILLTNLSLYGGRLLLKAVSQEKLLFRGY